MSKLHHSRTVQLNSKLNLPGSVEKLDEARPDSPICSFIPEQTRNPLGE